MANSKNLERNKVIQSTYHNEVEVPDFPRIEKVINVLSHERPGKLLDVGYSKGSFADYMVKNRWDCTAIDINKHEHSQIRTIQCDLNDEFPVEPESFDVVTAGEVVEHMLDEQAFVQECKRVLKNEGLLVITTPNLSFLANRFLVLIGKMPMFVYAPYHYHCHTKKTLVELLEGQGFYIEKVISSHVLYSRRRHISGILFEWLGNLFPTFGAHLIVFARKKK